jgi:hypothetical protein
MKKTTNDEMLRIRMFARADRDIADSKQDRAENHKMNIEHRLDESAFSGVPMSVFKAETVNIFGTHIPNG